MMKSDNKSFREVLPTIVGDTPPQQPTVLPIVGKNKLLPTFTTRITAVLDQPIDISRLEIENTGTDGGAADWIVNNIRIDGISLFKQCGDVPGDLFTTAMLESFVKFHSGTQIELIVTYIGLNESGCCFAGRLLGTIGRDDLQQPPPDVRVVLDEEVLAL